jgi:hypothetical protein
MTDSSFPAWLAAPGSCGGRARHLKAKIKFRIFPNGPVASPLRRAYWRSSAGLVGGGAERR